MTAEQHPTLGTFTESVVACDACGAEAPSSRRLYDDHTMAQSHLAERDGFTLRLFGSHLREFCPDCRLFAARGKELRHA